MAPSGFLINNVNFTHTNGIVKETTWLLATVVVTPAGTLNNKAWKRSYMPFNQIHQYYIVFKCIVLIAKCNS